MKRAGDPYDALASIFLAGGEEEVDAAPTDIDALAPVAAEWPVGGGGGEPSIDLLAHDPSPFAGVLPSGSMRPRGGRPVSVVGPGGVVGIAGTSGMPGASGVATTRSSLKDAPADDRVRSWHGMPAGPGTRGDGGASHLELLLLGHLPIRAASWLVPCVRAIVGPDRGAGLLRCEPGSVELELHGRAPTPGPARSVGEAIDAVRGPVRQWFMRPPTTLEVEELAELQPDAVTILTGGDPVAIASAWDLVRRLIGGADAGRWPRPQLGLAVVGVPRRQADALAEQLDRMTRERLGTSVELRCCVPRIEPGGVPVSVVRGTSGEADPVRLSTLIRGRGRGGGGGDAGRPDVLGAAERTPAASDDEADVETDTAPLGALLGSGMADTESQTGLSFVFPRREAAVSPASAPPAGSPALLRENPAGPTLARIVPPGTPAAAPLDTPRTSGHGNDPSVPPTRPEYARHVAELRPLAARCPSQPEIELAVDADGGLHVLGGVAAVRELPIVAEWALRHAELLAMACPDHAIDTGRRPQGHVFTDDPLAVSDLHQSQLHLHLLAEIEVDGRRAWFVSPLHRPRPS